MPGQTSHDPTTAAIASYQNLLHLEEDLYEKVGESLSPVETFLSDEQIQNNLEGEVSRGDLIEDGMLIEHEQGYRTNHFDLLYRLSNIRNRYSQDPLVFESEINIETEKVPDFGEVDIEELLNSAEVDPSTSSLISDAISATGSIEGLSSHQAAAITQVLSSENSCLTLDGPTASGKSLTFSIPAFQRALSSLERGQSGTTSLLLYPRQALIRDQLSTLLPRLDRINRQLASDDRPQISLGVDHGNTPKDLEPGETESFFGISCPRCDGDENNLEITEAGVGPSVQCPHCNNSLEYISPTKSEIANNPPTILLSTVWSVYHRLRSSSSNNATRYDNLEYVVLDEAHIYTNYVGGHVQYILQLLKEANTNGGARFVLSSATLANPVEFAQNLVTLPEDEISHVNYEDVLEEAGVEDERVLIHMYVLPPPNRSVETLNEAMVQCLNLWCSKNNYRALNFIDSITEINRQQSYIVEYILSPSGNNGDEVLRHLDRGTDTGDPFSWRPLMPVSRENDTRDDLRNYVTTEFARSIGIHTSELTDFERNRIEDQFNSPIGNKQLLLSTSTLEMGVDLNSVAAVLQYKLPPGQNEGVIQRIGRAGRNPDTYRVGLGVMEFSSTPSSMMYMFDEDLRGELENVSNLPPSRIGTSASIQVQHVLSRALHQMARDGHETYADGSGGIETRAELIDFLRELTDYLESTSLPESFVDPTSTRRDAFERQRREFLDQLRMIISGYESNQDIEEVNPERILTKSQRLYSEIRKIRRDLASVKRSLSSVPDIPAEYMEPIEETVSALRTITHLVNDLEETVRSAWYSRDPQELQNWIDAHDEELRSAVETIPERSEMHDLMFMDLTVWLSTTYGKTAELEDRYDLYIDEVANNLTTAVERFEPDRGDNFNSELEELLTDVENLQDQNLEVLASTHVLSRFDQLVNEYHRARGAHIFPVLNTILQNSIHFTGTFEAPQPEFEMEVTSA